MRINERLDKIKELDPQRYQELYSVFHEYLYPGVVKTIIFAYCAIFLMILFIAFILPQFDIKSALIYSVLGAAFVCVVIFGVPFIFLNYYVTRFFLNGRGLTSFESMVRFAGLFISFLAYGLIAPKYYEIGFSWYNLMTTIIVGIPANVFNAWLLRGYWEKKRRTEGKDKPSKKSIFRMLLPILVLWLGFTITAFLLLLPLAVWEYLGAWGLGIFWCVWFYVMLQVMRIMPLRRTMSKNDIK